MLPKEAGEEQENDLTLEDAPQLTVVTADIDIATGQGEHEGIGARDSIHGYLFHLRLCILFLLRSFELKKRGVKFSLAAEHKPLNPFDDIVCLLKTDEEKVYHLIQVKHGMPPATKKITAKDLTKTKFNNWGDKFCLHQYVKGYLKVKKLPVFASARTNFIVTTNIDLDLEDVKNGGISIKLCQDHLFSQIMKESDGRCYSLVPKEKSEFYRTVKKTSGATDQEMKAFLEDFILAVNLPNAALLENIINKDIGELCDISITEAIGSELQKKILEWINHKRGSWLTEENIEKLLKEVEEGIVALTLTGLDYSEILKAMNVLLKEESLQDFKEKVYDFIGPHSEQHLLQITVSPKESFLTAIKLRQVLESLEEESFQFLLVRFISLSYPKQKEYLKAVFRFRFTVNILVIYCKSKDNIRRHQGYLFAICKICVERGKKIILLSEEEIEIEDLREVVPQLRATYVKDVGFTFIELDLETQKRLLTKNAIIFQGNGNKINLLTLCRADIENMSETTTLLKQIIDSNTLVSLLRNEEIRIGNEVKDSLMLNDVYIERHLKPAEDKGMKGSSTKALQTPLFRTSDLQKMTSNPKLFLYCCENNLDEINSIPEDKFLREDNRVVMITDEAGMGKTSLLNSLVKKLRISDPNLWICRINLINFTKVFKNVSDKRNQEHTDNVSNLDLFVEHLMESQESTKLRTEFEKKLFRMAIDGYIKLILFFDGFDEICPKYEEIMTGLLISLKESNVEKLFVTTRPEEGRQLKDKLEANLMKIVPLTERQQGKFLVDYWGNALDLKESGIGLLEKVWMVAKWQMDRTSLQHPLTLVLMAESWQEPIKKIFFSAGSAGNNLERIVPAIEDTVRKLSSKFDILELTKYFVEKKFGVYQTEKSRDSKGNISSDNQFHYFINAVRVVHSHMGLIVTFGAEGAKELTGEALQIDEWMEIELPKIGILQRLGDNYHFIHQTFAEYFATEYIKNHPEKGRSLLFTDAWYDFIKNIHFSRRDYIRGYIIRGWFEKFKKRRCVGMGSSDVDKCLERIKYIHTYIALVSMLSHKSAQEMTGDKGADIHDATRREVEDVGLLTNDVERWGWSGLRFVDMFFARPFIKEYVNRHPGSVDRLSSDLMKRRALDGGIIDAQPEEYLKLKY